MAKKAGTKAESRKNPAKKAGKPEKLQVQEDFSREEGQNDAVNGAVKHRRYNVQNLTPYKKGEKRTKENASKGGTVKQMNALLLKANATVVYESGKIPELLQVALDSAKSNPMYSQALISVIKEAAKLVGATHDQSPEAVQNVNLKADVKKAETVKLVIEDLTKPEEGEGGGGE